MARASGCICFGAAFRLNLMIFMRIGMRFIIAVNKYGLKGILFLAARRNMYFQNFECNNLNLQQSEISLSSSLE